MLGLERGVSNSALIADDRWVNGGLREGYILGVTGSAVLVIAGRDAEGVEDEAVAWNADRNAPGIGGVLQAGEDGWAGVLGWFGTCRIGVLTGSAARGAVEGLGVEAEGTGGRASSLTSLNRVRSLFSTLFPGPSLKTSSLDLSAAEGFPRELTYDSSSSPSSTTDVSPLGRDQTYPNMRRIVEGGTMDTTVESPSPTLDRLGVDKTCSFRFSSTLGFFP